MFSSTISHLDTLRSSDVSQLIGNHSLELILMVLGALGIRIFYKIVKKSKVFGNLDGPASESLLWGNEKLMFNFERSSTIQEELLSKYGPVCRIKSILGEDRLWVADPRAMHEILQKAYDHFHEPPSVLAWLQITLGNNIVSTAGSKHKVQRKILNPVFTASHMRNLMPVFTEIAHQVEDIIARKAQENESKNGVVDIASWMSNVSLESIGQAGMGHRFGAMEKDQIEFLQASHQLLPLINRMWYLHPFIATLIKLGPTRFRRFVVDRLPFGPAQALKNSTDVVDHTANTIYKKKKSALDSGTLESEIATGNDVVSMLLKQSETLSGEEQMTEEEIVAQVSGLVFAGHDTTSSALARTLHFLAQHPDVQDQLRKEVQEGHLQYGKDLDYDQLNSLKYLDAVCRESLRLAAPVQRIQRVAGADWNLPLQHPVKAKDGRTELSSIHVPKGTHIYLSIGAINRDKEMWGEDASEFKPSRWLQPLPNSLSESKIPGVYSNT
uniref:Cytochrome P450 n=1 Tax=Thanatephorus cucumeris TaxID=107832 RepID=A0A2R4RMN3_THACU|nr:cytochrome P450 [Thanatephorus cucumeris]